MIVKRKAGRPPKAPEYNETSPARDVFSFGDMQRKEMETRIRKEFGNFGVVQMNALLAAANNAATYYAGGAIPDKHKHGRKQNLTLKVLLYDCSTAMKKTKGKSSLWQRAAVDGGGESAAVKLAIIIIEAVTGRSVQFDLRRMITSAKGIR